MSTDTVARSDLRRPRARRFNCRTAVSALALAIGLTACASSPHSPSAANETDKSAMLLKIADETNAAGDPATAASIYREVHDLSPKDPVPLAKLAATSMTMQDYRTAVDAYRAALALDANNSDFHRGLALALLAVGDAQGAMTEIRAALAKHGDDPKLYNALGVAEDMSGHHDLAQQDYRHGLDVSPGNVGLRNNYAMSLALAGDYAKAVQELGDIAGPTSAPRYRLNLALAYGLAGDDAHAAATARQVLDEASVQNNLAYYGLLRGMDEAHRTAAILGAEMHGSAIRVAEASAGQQNAHGDAPLAAAATPVAAAVLPPPLPTLDATADAKPDLPSLPIATVNAPAQQQEPPTQRMASASPKPHKTKVAAAPKSMEPAAASPVPTSTDSAAEGATPQAPASAEEPKAAEITPADAASPATAPMPAPAPKTATATPADQQQTAAASEPAPAPAPKSATASAADQPSPDASAAATETATAAPTPLMPAAPTPAAASESSRAADASPVAAAEPPTPVNDPAPIASIEPAAHQADPAPVASAEPPGPSSDPAPANATAQAPQQPAQTAAPQSSSANPPPAHTSEGTSTDTSAMADAEAAETVAALPAPETSSASPSAVPTATSDAKPRAPAHATVERFTVQLGSFALSGSADRVANFFTAKGVTVAITHCSDHDGRDWYVVRSGEFDNADDANSALVMIRSIGLVDPILVRHKIAAPETPAA